MNSFTGIAVGEWGSPWTPDRTSVFSVEEPRSGASRLDWGIPMSTSFSSYVEFEGNNFSVEPNALFNLGTLSYRNGTIESRSGFDGDFSLTLELRMGDAGSGGSKFEVVSDSTSNSADLLVSGGSSFTDSPRFDFNFNILNTLNDTGNQVLDGDILRFSTLGLSRQRFNFQGETYSLELIGFSSDGGQTYVGEFNSPEESVATANLYGRFIKVPICGCSSSSSSGTSGTSSTSSSISSISSSSIIDTFIYENEWLFNGMVDIDLGSIVEASSVVAAAPAAAPPPAPVGVPTYASSQIITDFSLLNLFGGVAASTSLGEMNGIFQDLGTGSDQLQLTAGIATLQRGGVRAFDGADNVTGSEVGDVVNGNQGTDLLTGEFGSDYLRGGKDEDRVYGGDDDDLLNGNKGSDFVDGGYGNDFVRGGAEDDILIGGEGDDFLVGDKGLDILTGGSGADGFVVRVDAEEGLGGDRISDLNLAEGDHLCFAGNISPTDLSFSAAEVDANGTSDAVIQLNTTGATLAVALNSNTTDVANAFNIVSSEDIALQIG